MKALVLSDIHIGHKSNKNIITELVQFITMNIKLLDTIDTLIIPGDMFDRPLPLGSEESLEAAKFFKWLDGVLSKHDITLIILDGTVSHDARQPRVVANNMCSTKTIFMDKIDIIGYNGLNILFVPDSLPMSLKKQEEYTIRLMKDRGLDKVDVAIMHGLFRTSIDISNIDTFEDDVFLNLVNSYIIIGHNHRHMKHDRIITPGSFSRLNHNEEEPKGGLYVEIGEGVEDRWVFIENKNAPIFDTIDLSKEESITKDRLWEFVKKYKPNSSIRFIYKDNQIPQDMQIDIVSTFKDFKIKFKKIKDTTTNINKSDTKLFEHVVVDADKLTPETLKDQLFENLPTVTNVTIEEVDSIFNN